MAVLLLGTILAYRSAYSLVDRGSVTATVLERAFGRHLAVTVDFEIRAERRYFR